ncbi:MAG: DUF3786 domain-containing protein, partial [Nitrospirae bacterium]|nr:DUF3786 domain-containing protein [Nitrospirota bacterium]
MSAGEEKAWEILSALDPEDVCKRAPATYDSVCGIYTLRSFGMDIFVSPKDKKIFSDAPQSDALLNRLGYFSQLSILWYLVNAKEISPSGNLVKPVNLKGGQLFFRGTHVLPVDKIAGKYRDDAEGFLIKGHELGAEKRSYGDASIRAFPLPRVPVVLILWRADEEYPPRVDLLLDSTS